MQRMRLHLWTTPTVRRAVLLGAGFVLGLALSALAIHAVGYRIVVMPPIQGTATMAQDALRQFPESEARHWEQAERQQRHAAAWSDDG